MSDKIIEWDKQNNTVKVSTLFIYFFLAMFILVVGSMFYYFTEQSNKIGFEDGYVCAYEYYQPDENTLALDSYSPSKYCQAFSQLFDFYAIPDSITVNGANIPVGDLIPENRRRLIEEGRGS